MLTDNQLFYVKRQAGMRLIVECGIVDFSDTSWTGNDVTEVVSNTVHDEMMKYITYRWPQGQVAYSDAILDQEWDLVRTLLRDLERIADLYLHGKIKLGVSLR